MLNILASLCLLFHVCHRDGQNEGKISLSSDAILYCWWHLETEEVSETIYYTSSTVGTDLANMQDVVCIKKQKLQYGKNNWILYWLGKCNICNIDDHNMTNRPILTKIPSVRFLQKTPSLIETWQERNVQNKMMQLEVVHPSK